MNDTLSPQFKAGERMVVRVVQPPGHIRTPFYMRGKHGVIERLCSTYLSSEELACGRDDVPRQPRYRVRFCQGEVWPKYRGGAQDRINVEIYQHWRAALGAQ